MATKQEEIEYHLEFMEAMGRRIRSGSCQFLFQLDTGGLTLAIGRALGKFQEALQEYRESIENSKSPTHDGSIPIEVLEEVDKAEREGRI
ncbi:unnamed protein product [marine sediment metagenome]|uniref:Uncharacterized protein n=1 Tax=marine sediment metagenome TaxID=412755 RepID=X1AD02_9ZZZZ